MLNDRSPNSQAIDSLAPLDKAATVGRLEQLALLPNDWNGYGACPIDPEVIRAASKFINLLPDDTISAPQIVPMTQGRLQFEWHRGHRTLELELETPTLIHYLKFDEDRGIEEEATLPVDDLARLVELVHWFHQESVNGS
jgi:hypothetical protein